MMQLLGTAAGGDSYWFSLIDSNPDQSGSKHNKWSSVDVDSDGNIYVGGAGNHTDVEGSHLYRQGLIAKYDKDGAEQYFRMHKMDSTSPEIDYKGVRVNSSGELYACLLGHQGSGGSSRFGIVKLNSNGTDSWKKGLGNNDGKGRAVQLDSSGNPIFSGYYNRHNEGNRSYSGVIVKTNSSGSLTWQKAIDNGTNNVGDEAAEDVKVVGSNYYTFGYLGSVGNQKESGVVVKWDTSGNVVWSRNLGEGSSGDSFYIYRGAVDSSGNVYASGLHNNNLAFIKYNSSGTLQWSKKASHSKITGHTNAMDVDDDGNIYIIGRAYNDNSTKNVFVLLKIDSSGSEVWARWFEHGYYNYEFRAFGLKVTSTAVHVVGFLHNSSTKERPIIIKMPLDGSITGTYGPSNANSIKISQISPSYSDVTFSYTGYTVGIETPSTFFQNASNMTTSIDDVASTYVETVTELS